MNTTILRFYMPIAAKVKHPQTFWQKIFGASLAGFLVKKAKEDGIKQAVFQKIDAGYLNGERLVFDQIEAVPPSLPVCVELIDEERKLRDFVEKVKNELSDCRAVLFQGAQILAVGKQEGR